MIPTVLAAPFAIGTRALVTGGGRGIGRGVALALAAAGVDVTVTSRTGADLASVAADAAAGDCDGSVTGVVADVRDEAAMADAVAAARPSLLVCAAGINRPGPLVDASLQDLRDVLDVNVLGTLVACRAFGRFALGSGGPGAVVTLSSQMGSVGYPGRAPYCASKHAVDGLTRALALEWAPAGIRVNAVAPTFVRTPFTEPMFAQPGFEAEVVSRIPLGRVGEVSDVCGAVLFLLGDGASLVTGHVLAVDGGWTAQ